MIPEFSEDEVKIFTLSFKNQFIKKLEKLYYKIFGIIKDLRKIIKSLRKSKGFESQH